MMAHLKTPMGTRAVSKLLSRKIRAIYKHTTWAVARHNTNEKKILFVFGASRSGKTLICESLEHDLRVKVFPETSELSGRDGQRLRFKEIPEIQKVFTRCSAPMIVVEAKVESQHAASLLQAFPGSKGIWVWRDFTDVVLADLRRFNSQRENLLPILNNDPTNWRSEHISDATRKLVRAHYSLEMTRADAAALFWYVRNVQWFEQKLDTQFPASLIRYEEFCQEPREVLTRIYRLMGCDLPGHHGTNAISTAFIGSREQLYIDSNIRAVCCALSNRLAASSADCFG